MKWRVVYSLCLIPWDAGVKGMLFHGIMELESTAG